jgi:hypothetical protein
MQTFSIQRRSKIHPNLDFWYENKPSGNLGVLQAIIFPRAQSVCSETRGIFVKYFCLGSRARFQSYEEAERHSGSGSSGSSKAKSSAPGYTAGNWPPLDNANDKTLFNCYDDIFSFRPRPPQTETEFDRRLNAKVDEAIARMCPPPFPVPGGSGQLPRAILDIISPAER